MKTSVTILLMLTPIIAFAQTPTETNGGDMYKMMLQMKKMQSCIAKIDQNKMKDIEQRSNQLVTELKSLCASGKRSDAQAKAISFGKEMKSNVVIKSMKKCSEIMNDMAPEMPFMDSPIEDSNQHVCDVQL